MNARLHLRARRLPTGSLNARSPASTPPSASKCTTLTKSQLECASALQRLSEQSRKDTSTTPSLLNPPPEPLLQDNRTSSNTAVNASAMPPETKRVLFCCSAAMALWTAWYAFTIASADRFEFRPFVFFGTWSRHTWAINVNPIWPAFAIVGAGLCFAKHPRRWGRSDVACLTLSGVSLLAFVLMLVIW